MYRMPLSVLLSKSIIIVGHKVYCQSVTIATFYLYRKLLENINKHISFWVKPYKKESEGTMANGNNHAEKELQIIIVWLCV
jgi:hypothetical protein